MFSLNPIPTSLAIAIATLPAIVVAPAMATVTDRQILAVPSEIVAISPQQSPKQSVTTADIPMPNDARNVSKLPSPGTGSLNFQTNLSLSETLAFYRQQMRQRGLTERQTNTTVADNTFSVVFDGWPGGSLPLVVQGTDLGGVVTNVNIRFDSL